MGIVRSKFTLKDDDIERLRNAVVSCGTSSENVINDYLHTSGAEKIVESVTRFIPVSKKGKRHAKSSKWYKQTNYNMAVAIENNSSGKKSFYYLYYVATGTGTSSQKGANNFMDKGMNKIYDKVVDDLVNELEKNIERKMI